MKKGTRRFAAVAVLLVAGLLAAACAGGGAPKSWRTLKAKTFNGLPVPENAEKVESGDPPAVPTVFASEMTMGQAADWYEDKLKSAGLAYEKSPEKPDDEGYTIFDITDKGRDKKVVIVNDSNKTGINIQISGEL